MSTQPCLPARPLKGAGFRVYSCDFQVGWAFITTGFSTVDTFVSHASASHTLLGYLLRFPLRLKLS